MMFMVQASVKVWGSFYHMQRENHSSLCRDKSLSQPFSIEWYRAAPIDYITRNDPNREYPDYLL